MTRRVRDVMTRDAGQVLRRPGARLLTGLAAALQSSARTLHTPGLGEGPGARSRTPAAIKADVSITRRQRRMLIDIYESFQKENHAKAAHTRPAPAAEPGGDALPGRSCHTRQKKEWPMKFADEFKRIAESKPFCAVAGAGGYAADQWRKMRSRDVPATARTLQGKTAETITRDLPARARGYVGDAVDRVTRVYDDLAVRGREIVSSFSREAAHEFEEVSQAAKPKAAPARIPGRRQESVVKPSPVGAPVGKKQESVVRPSPVGAPVKNTAKGSTRTGTTRTRGKT
ncbi:hypothetical protein ACTMTI_38665 [Nonomuraea sp. H19]|uniref:hypothetical protein n=1 Tax=Nonomuraea sp. H19 TaxID=3452206 RepID=UPI003F8971AA